MRYFAAAGLFALLIQAGASSDAPQPEPADPDPIQIVHSGPSCVVAGQFPSLEARFEPADRVRQARVHFRPEGGRHWYSVAMEQRGDLFLGVLPKPKTSLHRLDYYIEVTGASLESGRTAEHSPQIESGPGACEGKKAAAVLASAVVKVIPPEGVGGAPIVPAGFSGSGVVPAAAPATGSATAAAAGAGSAAGAAAAAGGVSGTLLIVGGVAVAGGVAAVTVGGGGDEGDGGSPPSVAAAPTPGPTPAPTPEPAPTGPQEVTVTGYTDQADSCSSSRSYSDGRITLGVSCDVEVRVTTDPPAGEFGIWFRAESGGYEGENRGLIDSGVLTLGSVPPGRYAVAVHPHFTNLSPCSAPGTRLFDWVAVIRASPNE
jgi:hypothetical protein